MINNGASEKMEGGQRQSALDTSVLVLNKFYSAVRIVNARRAFSLIFKNHAEAVDVENQSFRNYDFDSWVSESTRKTANAMRPEVEECVKTPRFNVLVPKIIRLVSYDKMPKREVKFNRRNILARDGHRCQYCGKRFAPSSLSIDHIVPKSRGGKTVWSNVVAACNRCNARKGDTPLHESGMKLIKQPTVPKKNPFVVQKMKSERYSVWQHFLICQETSPEI